MTRRRLALVLHYCKPLRTIERDSGPFMAAFIGHKGELHLR